MPFLKVFPLLDDFIVDGEISLFIMIIVDTQLA